MSPTVAVVLVALVLGAVGLTVAVWWLASQLTTLGDAVADLSVRQAAALQRMRALELQQEGLTQTVTHLAHELGAALAPDPEDEDLG